MACLDCMIACSEAFYKEYDPDKSCVQILAEGDGPNPVVCDQCGKCAEACEFGAITQNPKGVYMINKKICTACGKCAEVCPSQLIVKPQETSIATKCIACGICVRACSQGVLEVADI